MAAKHGRGHVESTAHLALCQTVHVLSEIVGKTSAVAVGVRERGCWYGTEMKQQAETREVISAAEEPMPVLWTLDNDTPVAANGSIDSREVRVRGRFSDANCPKI